MAIVSARAVTVASSSISDGCKYSTRRTVAAEGGSRLATLDDLEAGTAGAGAGPSQEGAVVGVGGGGNLGGGSGDDGAPLQTRGAGGGDGRSSTSSSRGASSRPSFSEPGIETVEAVVDPSEPFRAALRDLAAFPDLPPLLVSQVVFYILWATESIIHSKVDEWKERLWPFSGQQL